MPLGLLLSRIDGWLVYSVAPIAGVGIPHAIWRYGFLLSQLASACIFSWFAPAPFGLIGTVWAILLAIAVTRRWAWIEADRTILHANPATEQSALKVGTKQDLRDEALFGLLFLLLILPFGMRQFHLSFPSADMFALSGNARGDPLAWAGFFGVELLKAMPFLDWADIYDAHGVTRITINGPEAMHAVFAGRIILDLVFLSALVQAVTISVSLAKHKRDFLNPRTGVNALDERIAAREVSRLVDKQDGNWIVRPEAAHFTHYDIRALSRLKREAQHHTRERLLAAISAVERLGNLKLHPPSEQLVEIALDKRPDPEDLRSAIQLVVEEEDFDLPLLAATSRALRRKSGLETERKLIAQLIRKHISPSPDREMIFAEMLTGDHKDSLLNVRLIALDCLIINHRVYESGVDAIRAAAGTDPSAVIRRKASDFLKSKGVFGEKRANQSAA